MLTDLLLAVAHHILIFGLLSLLIIEMMLIRQGVTASVVRRLATIDQAYGAVALLILVVGFCRVFFGDKGSAFYIFNWVFWAKVAAFVLIGLLSIVPTMRILQWRKALAANPSHIVPAEDAIAVRRFMHWQGIVFVLIPIFAALMARGYGL